MIGWSLSRPIYSFFPPRLLSSILFFTAQIPLRVPNGKVHLFSSLQATTTTKGSIVTLPTEKARWHWYGWSRVYKFQRSVCTVMPPFDFLTVESARPAFTSDYRAQHAPDDFPSKITLAHDSNFGSKWKTQSLHNFSPPMQILMGNESKNATNINIVSTRNSFDDTLHNIMMDCSFDWWLVLQCFSHVWWCYKKNIIRRHTPTSMISMF